MGDVRRAFHDQRGSSGLISGRLKNVVAIANFESEAAELLQRKAREVDFARLTVGKRDAVIDHRRMARTDASHRHRLHAAGAAVVAHGCACEVLQGVGQGMDAEKSHLFRVDALHGNRGSHGIVFSTRHHIHALQIANDAIALCISSSDAQQRQHRCPYS